MSVYIKGMEIPFTCLTCDFHKCAGGVGDFCTLTKKKQFRFKNRPSYCPLIPVPDHGRLIDADALIKVLKTKAKNPLNQETAPYSWTFAYECFADAVGDMPTIIPADKEGEG